MTAAKGPARELTDQRAAGGCHSLDACAILTVLIHLTIT
jgi:hypothetical protein